MFAYSFGNPTDEWNSKKLNSPLPCPYGVKCTKDNCIGVHPGEEGTKRKYFPGRNVPHKLTGNMVYQQPCVRLVGNDKYDIPGYYKRRTQKLSWPEWCKAQEAVAMTGFTPSYHFYPQVLQADFLLGSQLTALHLAEDSAMKKARMGDQIFARVNNLLAESEAITRQKGHWVEGFSAAKATGMIMQMLYSDPDPVAVQAEAVRVLCDDQFLIDLVADCLITCSQATA